MLVSPPPPSFLDTYRNKALSIVINFLILWSIYLSYFLVPFKNDPEYLITETAQVFILLIRFLLGFEKLSCCREILFSFFYFFSVWWCLLSTFPSTCNVHIAKYWKPSLLLLLLNFQFYSWFLTILHWVFTQDLLWKKLVIICILSINFVCCLF